ncbi:menaquinone reductase iron-sulfur cluster-binding subunit QrcC [Maridesulfovibrio bastinii]|uniref:menaquinone reductase iron-sulfur cluster-binding subunit QrcC n=1 Tax=Maridesulfovibrio bastinii TaxID=47157 RepID=UPI000424954C|nr:menaquinone reductase iron-sulfur cluster-binding subunit QrcC [Maridesulfovibrio bastinii]
MHNHIDFETRYVMCVDIDKCTGCGACMVSCQAENNIAPMEDGSNKLKTLTWMLVYELNNGKNFPDREVAYLPRPCMQCENPACVPVCPVVATAKDEEGGIVSQIYPRCIGCRYCMAACPYHARYFGWFDPKWPEGMDKTLSPMTSTRPRGVVEKCNFCHTRLMNARQRARQEGVDPLKMPEDWYQPACVESCPSGAITFGDINNPEHKVHELAHSKYAFRLLEKLGMDPQVYYISRREWVRKQADHHTAEEKH